MVLLLTINSTAARTSTAAVAGVSSMEFWDGRIQLPGSVISYNVYWVSIIVLFRSMRYNEVKGHWPMMGGKKIAVETRPQDFVINFTASDSTGNDIVDDKTRAKTAVNIRTVDL